MTQKNANQKKQLLKFADIRVICVQKNYYCAKKYTNLRDKVLKGD